MANESELMQVRFEKEEKIKRYEAEFEYAGAQYEIKGVVEKEEFEKILKNLIFF